MRIFFERFAGRIFSRAGMPGRTGETIRPPGGAPPGGKQLEFLANIAHELQTPVAIMKGNMEILLRRRGGDTRDALRVMDATIERMARSVDTLVDIARMDFSSEAIAAQKISVKELLEEVREDCAVLAEYKKVSLRYEDDGSHSGGARVRGDREKLREVVLNLVSNALKHTGAGGSISLEGRVNGPHAVITVTDTGTGIAPDDLPRLFTRFYRIHGGNAPGMGLGLHICRQIVAAHGGTISVRSEVGAGSAFTVTLPRVR